MKCFEINVGNLNLGQVRFITHSPCHFICRLHFPSGMLFPSLFLPQRLSSHKHICSLRVVTSFEAFPVILFLWSCTHNYRASHVHLQWLYFVKKFNQFKDLICFMKRFVNAAAPHLATRRELWVVQNGMFYRQKEGGTEKSGLFQITTSLGEGRESYHACHLTTTVVRKIPDWWV